MDGLHLWRQAMIFELARALNTAHFVLDGKCVSHGVSNDTYKPWERAFRPDEKIAEYEEPEAHLWVRKSRSNYEFALSFLFELLSQYIEQNGYPHIVESSGLYKLLAKGPPANIPAPPAFSASSRRSNKEPRLRFSIKGKKNALSRLIALQRQRDLE